MSLTPRQVDFNVIWDSLQETIKGVITLGHVPRPVWNDRFSDVYSLCVAYPESMADRLYAETKQYLIDHVARLLTSVQDSDESQLIKSYWSYWAEYSVGVRYLHSLYLYLNQQHIKTHKLSDAEIIYGSPDSSAGDQMEIGELALEVWKTGMIAPLGKRLVKLLLEAIDDDRKRITSNHPMEAVEGTILSFVEVQGYKKKGQLQLYQELFEEPFLDTSGVHFNQDAAHLLEERNVSVYMERVIAKIDEELLRARKFLHASSLPKVSGRCQQHMVAEHLAFLYSECGSMVAEERRHDLTNMYNLLKSLPNAIFVLVDTVLEHIKSQGLAAIGNLQGDNVHIHFVENLLSVYHKYRDQISRVFSGDQNFMGALDKACSSVINYRGAAVVRSPSATVTGGGGVTSATVTTPQCRSPELLARYCDTLLKKSSRGVTEAEVEEKLAQSITIFKYIDDKDVFQKFYSRMLAKRLIHQQTQSMDAEEAMINRLKQACGYEFTSKLHRMFTDMSVSADLNNKFSAHLKTVNVDLAINFSIYILQAGAWPLGQAVVTPFALPQQLEKSVQMFEEFYHQRFNGRRLTWLHHLCQAELRLGYLRRAHVVTVQTFQMALLLLFETADTLTAREMRETLQLTCDQFQRHLASLVESKLLLVVTPASVTSERGERGSTSLTSLTSSTSLSSVDATSVNNSLLELQGKGAADAAGGSSDNVKSGVGSEGRNSGDSEVRSGSSSSEVNSGVTTSSATGGSVVFGDEVILRLNKEYSNKRTRFRITAAVQQRESPAQEAEHTINSVEEDRKLYLQAAIVRVMKARKVLKHTALIQEVCAQSKHTFAPSIPMVKKCIEALIDKQYIERTAHSTEEYSYVA